MAEKRPKERACETTVFALCEVLQLKSFAYWKRESRGTFP